MSVYARPLHKPYREGWMVYAVRRGRTTPGLLTVQPLLDAAEGECSGGRRVAGGIRALRDQRVLVEADDLHREVHTDNVGVECHRGYQVYGVSLNRVCPAVRHEDRLVVRVPDTGVVG